MGLRNLSDRKSSQKSSSRFSSKLKKVPKLLLQSLALLLFKLDQYLTSCQISEHPYHEVYHIGQTDRRIDRQTNITRSIGPTKFGQTKQSTESVEKTFSVC